MLEYLCGWGAWDNQAGNILDKELIIRFFTAKNKKRAKKGTPLSGYKKSRTRRNEDSGTPKTVYRGEVTEDGCGVRGGNTRSRPVGIVRVTK